MNKSSKPAEAVREAKGVDELAAESYRVMVAEFGVAEANNRLLRLVAELRERGAEEFAEAYVRAAFAAA